MRHIAVDVGHGWVKALADDATTAKFQALIIPAPKSVSLGSFGTSHVWRINDKEYYVGEAASNQGAAPLWGRDKADEDSAALLAVAIASLKCDGAIHLAVGLPLSWYATKAKDLRRTLLSSDWDVSSPDGTNFKWKISDVLVAPQGVAASIPALSNAAVGNWLVVDIGWRTTDYVIGQITDNHEMDVDPSSAGTIEIGMRYFYERVARQLEALYDVPMTAETVGDQTEIVIRGKKVSLVAMRSDWKSILAAQLERQISAKLENRIHQISGTVLVGGGAAELQAAWSGDVIVPDDPQTANVRGFLAALNGCKCGNQKAGA